MFNMRVDIVRKEMERRFEEIEGLVSADEKRVDDAIDEFLLFLFSEPMVKDFLIELSEYDDKFLNSKDYQNIKNDVTRLVKQLAKEFCTFADKNFKKQYIAEYHMLSNCFNMPNPDINGQYLSLDKFIKCMKSFDKYNNHIIDQMGSLINEISNIVQFAGKSKINANWQSINNSLWGLIDIRNRIEAFTTIKAKYDGAHQLLNLLPRFLIDPCRHLVNIPVDKLSEATSKHKSGSEEVRKYKTSQSYHIALCRDVYHAVDRYLVTGKSKSTLIERLIVYCTWIKRESFLGLKPKNKEQQISKIVEEFIFNYGYFPIVNFKAGKNIPDILSMGRIGWQDSVLIELKQYIGKKLTSQQLLKDIEQSRDYLTIVKGANPDIADIVYLLIFYDGKERLAFNESDNLPKDVKIEFIYVGKESPSKLNSRILST